MRIVFMGTPSAATTSLDRLVVDGHDIAGVYTQPDRPSGRGNKIIFSPVKERAFALGLKIFQPEKVRTLEAADEFRSLSADLAVVVAYGRILPPAFLRAFPRGAINVHFSLLPKYRGAAPVNWAIVNGENETGVTTMLMDDGLDTGDILLQEKTAIFEGETSIELMTRLAAIGAELLSRTLKQIDQIVPRRQDNAAATYAPLMKKGDGLIDWSMTAADISRRVLGFQPFPSAFTTFRGSRFTIWKSSISDLSSEVGIPGEILFADGGKLFVAAGGKTVLSIDEAQSEGKRRMPINDILNGMRPVRGERFGN